MSLSCGFYNSKDGDRHYDAVDVSTMFDGIMTDGVLTTVGSRFETTAGTGMQVSVGRGKAWFNNTWTYNDSGLLLNVEPSDVVYSRIDTVVLEVDATQEVRNNRIFILTGTISANPEPAQLNNTATRHRYPLAYITVHPNDTSITDIENNVGNKDCPFAKFIASSPFIVTLEVDPDGTEDFPVGAVWLES